MRSVVLFTLLAAMAGLSTSSMPAQAPKTDAKDEAPKEPEYKWPAKIQEKNIDAWIKEMRTAKDASDRDEAIRTIPFFGPTAGKSLGHHLIDAIKLDPDINVRLTAIAAVPILGFDDAVKEEGIDTLINILKSPTQPNQTRFVATTALGNCGRLKEARKAIPTLIAVTLVDTHSWQNRKAAAAALGSLGQPMLKEDGKPEDGGPNLEAVKALARLLYLDKKDPSHLVRREAILALLVLGPPEDAAAKKLVQAALKESYEQERNKSVVLWARVAYMRIEPKQIGPTDPNLLYIAKIIPASDTIIRQQKGIEAEITKSNKLESKFPLEKQDALDKMQTALQARQEALQAKQEALQALGELGELAVSRLDDLIAIAQGKAEEPIIIATALWAMSQMRSQTDKVLPVIDELAQAKDESIKAAAEAARKLFPEKPKKDEPPKK